MKTLLGTSSTEWAACSLGKSGYTFTRSISPKYLPGEQTVCYRTAYAASVMRNQNGTSTVCVAGHTGLSITC